MENGEWRVVNCGFLAQSGQQAATKTRQRTPAGWAGPKCRLAGQDGWGKLPAVRKTNETRLLMAHRYRDYARRCFLLEFVLVAGASLLCLPAKTALGGEAQVLHGSVPAAVARLAPVGRLPASQHLDVVLALPLRNREKLEVLLQQIYDPASPNFRHYLTPQQFTGQFGPEEADYQSLIAFANGHGLKVTGTHANRTLLDVNGTVAEIEKAFHVSLRTYQHPAEARLFYAPEGEPSLDLAAPVLTVSGLDDFILPRPMNLNTNFFKRRANATALTTGSGPSGNFLGKDFRAAYAPGVALDGAGQWSGCSSLTATTRATSRIMKTWPGCRTSRDECVAGRGQRTNPGK